MRLQDYIYTRWRKMTHQGVDQGVNERKSERHPGGVKGIMLKVEIQRIERKRNVLLLNNGMFFH